VSNSLNFTQHAFPYCTHGAHDAFQSIDLINLLFPSIIGATANSLPRATGGGVMLVMREA
jgi:hypothetical protein